MRIPLVCCVVGLFPLFPAAPAAQLLSDTLVADINHGAAVVHGFGEGIASAGGLAYFQANDAESGESYRLWRSDGTAAGTLQLASQALLVLEAVALPDGGLFFIADELGIGAGLWRSDGSSAGTTRVLAPLPWTNAPHDLTVFGGAVWFLASLPGSGLELWASDLSTGATASVPGPASGSTQLFTGAGKLFAAHLGQGLVRAFDGAAFEIVAELAVPAEGSCALVAQAGARVVFNVGGFEADAGWWGSDGTALGTHKLLGTLNDFWSASGATKAYVTAGSVANVPLLWETDGTPAGTEAVDLPSTSGGQRVSFDGGIALGDDLYYQGFVPGAGFELCRTSGAASGAALLADLRPGTAGSNPNDFLVSGGAVFFRAEDGVHGREIWSVGPSTSAALAADLFPGPSAGIVGSPPTLFAAQSAVVFGNSFAGAGIELGFTDGMQSGLLVNIGDEGESAGSSPSGLLRLGKRVVFQALDEATGTELWITDGTTAGTALLADIDPTTTGFPGTLGSFPHHFARFANRAFFFAFHPSFGSELWSTDGTAAGTSLVRDLMPGPASSEPLFSSAPVALDDAIYFIAHEPDGDFGLFKSDGTAAGTTLVATTDPTGFVAEFTVLVRVNDRLLFLLNGPAGLEVGTSDGTLAGTTLLADMTAGGSSFVRAIVAGETRAYLSVSAGGADTLWVTDGTPAGTSKFFDSSMHPGLAPAELATLGDRLFFQMFTPEAGSEPWTSDGSAAGTTQLGDLAPGPASSQATAFTAAHDRVFFTTESPLGSFHHQRLWITDGTSAGTALVAELPSPPAGAGIAGLWHASRDRRILFSNVDANGSEWWVSDGTALGTLPLTDIAPGPKFAEPAAGAALASRLLFSAADGAKGVELHALPLSATGGHAAVKLGQGCATAHGTPALFVESGAPVLGASLVVSVEHAAPNSIAVWAIDGVYGALPPQGACTVQLPAPKLLGSTPTDGSGKGLLAAQVPSMPSLLGGVAVVQTLSLEPGGPFLGLGALSDALELVVGP